jgi:hypothetical protein
MERRALLFASLLLMAASSSPADDMPKVVLYGHLRGRFVYDGKPPKPELIKMIGFEKEGLDKLKLVDESLVVNPENRGLANVVVCLHVPKGEAPPAMHPSYRFAPDTSDQRRTRTMSMLDTRYIPHVLLVRTDEIYLSVSDTVRSHNPKLDLTANHDSCAIMPPGSTQTHEFRHPERTPILLSDNIYPWMRAWVVIQDHPYMAATDADGQFEIRNIPAGQRTFRLWHEKTGFVSAATVDGRKVTWEKGLAMFELRAGETVDLGDARIAPTLFDN